MKMTLTRLGANDMKMEIQDICYFFRFTMAFKI